MSMVDLIEQFSCLTEYRESRVVQWRRAKTASHLAQGMSVRQMAKEIGFSRSYLGDLIRTWRAFEGPVVGLNGLTFAHYRAAAKTAVPFFWLEMAVELNLSARELAKILKLGPLATRCFGGLKRKHRQEMDALRAELAVAKEAAEEGRRLAHLLERVELHAEYIAQITEKRGAPAEAEGAKEPRALAN